MLLRLVGEPWQRAFPAALIMAQIGEFSFALAAIGFGNRVLTPDGYKLAISVIAMSLLISPFWMRSVRRFDAAMDKGISSFRDALAEVYGEELAEFGRGAALLERGRRAVTQRARALRCAWSRPKDEPAAMEPPPGEGDKETRP